MAEQPRTPRNSRASASSVLEESWVMASIASIKDANLKENQAPEAPSPQFRERRKNTPSTKPIKSPKSPSSVLGPELIMPSIYETPISEASWVAPNLRAEVKTSKKPPKTSQPQLQPSPIISRTDSRSSVPKLEKKRQSVFTKLGVAYYRHSDLIRKAINGLLIAFILHLLVLPEVIYQVQDLCQLPILKTSYPESCVRPIPNTFQPYPASPISPEQSITASQKHLEAVFDSSLRNLTSLALSLKESEKMLHKLQDHLESSFPSVRNALDLEFRGSDQAMRTAAWEFDSLRADLRSAVDSLIASQPSLEMSGSIARDARSVAQIQRRGEYLDRLRSQISTKADSLGNRLSTLDDHLEAVDGIIAREERRATLLGPSYDGSGSGLQAILNSIFASRPSPSEESNPEPQFQPVTTVGLLRLAATHHHPVADSVLRLSRQLRDISPRL